MVSQIKLKFNRLFSFVNCSIYTSIRTIANLLLLHNIKAQSIPCLILCTNSAEISPNKSFVGWTLYDYRNTTSYLYLLVPAIHLTSYKAYWLGALTWTEKGKEIRICVKLTNGRSRYVLCREWVLNKPKVISASSLRIQEIRRIGRAWGSRSLNPIELGGAVHRRAIFQQ
jgi:hypothetical protein